MLTTPKSLPSDPAELRVTAEGLVELAKSQALQIEKLKHQLGGHQRYRFGSKSESAYWSCPILVPVSFEQCLL